MVRPICKSPDRNQLGTKLGRWTLSLKRGWPMARYYFDIRGDAGVSIDEEGLEFSTQQEAEIEGAMSLADMAQDFAEARRDVSVEVRTDTGRVFQAAFIFNRSKAEQ